MGCWWKRFNDPLIDKFINRLIVNNLDIKQATFRILELRAKLRENTSYLFPQIETRFSASRYRQNIEYDLPYRGDVQKKEINNSYSLTLDVSYELDLWKKLRNIKSASLSEFMEAKEQKRILIQSLVYQGMCIYFKLAALLKEQQLIKQKIELQNKLVKIVENRFLVGKLGLDAVMDEKRLLDDLNKESLIIHKSLAGLYQDLYILMGEYPDKSGVKPSLDILTLKLWKIPAGLPSSLIYRRPDIRAKMARVRAMFLLKKASFASFFPSITLTGFLGYRSSELKSFFSSQNLIWNIASSILQPIFKAGRIKAQYEKAKAKYMEEVISCAKTILTAFKEVERGLLNYEVEVKTKSIIEEELNDLIKKLNIIKQRYEKGKMDVIYLLKTNIEILNLKQSLIQTKLNILLNYVYLYKTLGGDWDISCLKLNYSNNVIKK